MFNAHSEKVLEANMLRFRRIPFPSQHQGVVHLENRRLIPSGASQ